LKYSVNPHEAVALDAAIFAYNHWKNLNPNVILPPDSIGDKEILLQDVIPLSLGTDLRNGGTDFLIRRNTTYPCSRTRRYVTTRDDQTEMQVMVVEGEREMFKDNKKLGMFNLVGIPPAPAKTQMVDVTFSVDKDCVLQVSAELVSNIVVNKSIVVKGSNNLSRAELDRMIREAEEYRRVDQERIAAIKASDDLSTYINMTRDKFDGGYIGSRNDRDHINNLLNEAEDWLIDKQLNAAAAVILAKQRELEAIINKMK